MKKSKFTEEQMVRILREADETNAEKAAKKHGVPFSHVSNGIAQPCDAVSRGLLFRSWNRPVVGSAMRSRW